MVYEDTMGVVSSLLFARGEVSWSLPLRAAEVLEERRLMSPRANATALSLFTRVVRRPPLPHPLRTNSYVAGCWLAACSQFIGCRLYFCRGPRGPPTAKRSYSLVVAAGHLHIATVFGLPVAGVLLTGRREGSRGAALRRRALQAVLGRVAAPQAKVWRRRG